MVHSGVGLLFTGTFVAGGIVDRSPVKLLSSDMCALFAVLYQSKCSHTELWPHTMVCGSLLSSGSCEVGLLAQLYM